MPATPFLIRSWPRAILHLDADAFFASVEQALDPALKGKPVVTGQERGIVSAASYEAKALGIPRGMPIYKLRREFPHVIVRSSGYKNYGLFSSRMFTIVRAHIPTVEVTSIDEGYAELTGVRRMYKQPYKSIAGLIKTRIESSLGITVSLGVSTTKTLAKIASKFRKPSGLTAVSGKHIHLLLARTPLEKVPGFGPNTQAYLRQHGVHTALEFALRPHEWARQHLGKIGSDLWHELRGTPIYELAHSDERAQQQSLSKIKTFTPPTTDYALLRAHCVRNTEDICAKLRALGLETRTLALGLKTQQFHYVSEKIALPRPTCVTRDLIPLVETLLQKIYDPTTPIRATFVAFHGLVEARDEQLSLFEHARDRTNARALTNAQDAINTRYGRRAITSASTLHPTLNSIKKAKNKDITRVDTPGSILFSLPLAQFTV